MGFMEILKGKDEDIKVLSDVATKIIKEYYDPIVGPVQNEYMIDKFQSVRGINEQLEKGYRYFLVQERKENIGFIAFYPRGDAMYLSKLYLKKEYRGKGYTRSMIGFVKEAAKKEGKSAIELNVNKNNISIVIYEKLGFVRIRDEKNDIGNGFFMDDYVYRLEL